MIKTITKNTCLQKITFIASLYWKNGHLLVHQIWDMIKNSYICKTMMDFIWSTERFSQPLTHKSPSPPLFSFWVICGWYDHQTGWQSSCYVRDHAQNTTSPAISLVVNNVIPLLIGPPAWVPITSIMYDVGEGTRPCPFPLRGTDTDGLPSPRATTSVVVFWAWSLT